jgi:hypothetical protein
MPEQKTDTLTKILRYKTFENQPSKSVLKIIKKC